MDNLLILFIVLSIVNVIGGTIKSIATINGSTLTASIVNALYFGFYTIVIIYTSCELNLWLKVLIVAISNFIGVFIVKTIEKKITPSKMWKVEMAVPISPNDADDWKRRMEIFGIPCNYQQAGKWIVYNCYCYTKEDTNFVKKICKDLNGNISAYKSEALGAI